MRKFVVLLLMLVLVVGCGKSKEGKTKFKDFEPQTDYVKMGMEHLAKSDIPRAIGSFDEAIRQDPGNTTNYIILGQVYLRLNNVQKAIDTFNAATRVDTSNGEIYYLLAYIHGLTGNKKEAIQAVKRSVEIFIAQKNQEKLVRSMALLQSLAQSETLQGQEEAAKEGKKNFDQEAAQQVLSTIQD